MNNNEWQRQDRVMSPVVELNQSAIEIMGQRLEPDASKGYFEFQIAQGLQITVGSNGAPDPDESEQGSLKTLKGVNTYRSALHPAVVAASHGSMLHQVLNRGHEMKANNRPGSKPGDAGYIARDHVIGAVVAVEFPKAPSGGWGLAPGPGVRGYQNPIIRGAAVLHKKAEGVGKLLADHLTGKHRHTVSMEVHYSLLDSGFLVGNLGKASAAQTELLADLTPEELSGSGYGYVPVSVDAQTVSAPEALLACYNSKKNVVDQDWEGLPVVLLKGGLAGAVHFQGVGMVRFGAEREAEIQQLLAADPNALDELAADGVVEVLGGLERFLGALRDSFGRKSDVK